MHHLITQRYRNLSCKNKRLNGYLDNLQLEDLFELYEKQGGRCAITGIELTHSETNRHANVSIDRIDNLKPYSLDNVRLVCNAVNIMRHEMSDDQLGEWCVAVVKGMGLWK